jgi:glycosylphosphatidylinositol transamidase
MGSPPSQGVAPLSIVLKSFTLCLGGTVTALLSLLNFSLAATTVVLLGVPLSYLPPTKSSKLRSIGVYCLLPLLTPPLIALGFEYLNGQTELVRVGRMVIWEWKVLGVWTLPFAMIVYLPLVWQAQATCILALV